NGQISELDHNSGRTGAMSLRKPYLLYLGDAPDHLALKMGNCIFDKPTRVAEPKSAPPWR
ncbi:MAG: hypothetical protein V2I43_12755, partial [Parvularcula sp.]|nr:hypothetical protein [Parvularcula sp.]